ncbi:hypothetical protein LVY75_07195 (plasmid) [Sinorhizobium sp. B11]|jgi:hypothetical protein
METIMNSITLDSAVDYFAEIRHPHLPTVNEMLRAGAPLPSAPKDPQTAFNTTDNGLISVILAQPKVPDSVQKELDVQRQNLIDLTGVASAYVRKAADKANDPNKVYDTMLWQSVFNHLPLMGPSQFVKQTMTQNIKGVELAGKFISTILGVAVGGGPALASFAEFVSGLGDSIRMGVQTGTKSYSVGTISIVLEGQQVGNEIKINPWLKGYFIDFTQDEKKIYSSCGSAESFSMSFSYRVATSLFNYGALANADVKKKYDAFISGTQIDDIESATNFFDGKFDTN